MTVYLNEVLWLLEGAEAGQVVQPSFLGAQLPGGSMIPLERKYFYVSCG